MDVQFRRATNADREIVQQVVDGALRDYGLGIVLEAGDVDLRRRSCHAQGRAASQVRVLCPTVLPLQLDSGRGVQRSPVVC